MILYYINWKWILPRISTVPHPGKVIPSPSLWGGTFISHRVPKVRPPSARQGEGHGPRCRKCADLRAGCWLLRDGWVQGGMYPRLMMAESVPWFMKDQEVPIPLESISGVSGGGKAPLPLREGLSTPKAHKGDASTATPNPPGHSRLRWLLRAWHRALPPSPPSCSVPEEGVKQPQSCAWQLLWQLYIFLMIPNDLLAFALIYGFFGCWRWTHLPSAPRSRHIPCSAGAWVGLGEAALVLPPTLGTASLVLPQEQQRQEPPANPLQEADAKSPLVFSPARLREG